MSRGLIGACRGAANALGLIFKILLPLVLLFGAAGGIAYVRLLNGPISLAYFVAPIARGLSAELEGLSAEIDGAQVALGERGFEFQLTGVRLREAGGALVAVAPQAGIEISGLALMRGQLAPAHIVLIDPRMLLFFGEDGRLSLSFSRAERRVGASAPATPTSPRLPSVSPDGQPGAPASNGTAIDGRDREGELDLARVLVQAARHARRQRETVSYLRSIGVRNAALFLDNGGQQTAWSVPLADIALRFGSVNSEVTGLVTLASESGVWSIAIAASDDEKRDTVDVRTTVRNLVPSTLARIHPGLAWLQPIDLPLGIQSHVELAPTGEVRTARATVVLGVGDVEVAAMRGLRTKLAGGTLQFSYDPAGRRLVLLPSRLDWSGSHLTLKGEVSLAAEAGQHPRWPFRIEGIDGVLSQATASSVKRPQGTSAIPAGPSGHPVKRLLVIGGLQPDDSAIIVDQLALDVGTGALSGAGSIRSDAVTRGPVLTLDGAAKGLSEDVVMALWPPVFASDARTWLAKALRQLTVSNAAVQVSALPLDGAAMGASGKISVNVEMASVAFEPAPGLPQVWAPRALLSLQGRTLEVVLPEASLEVQPGHKLTLRSARLSSSDITADGAEAAVSFRLLGGLSETALLMQQMGGPLGQISAINIASLGGQVEAQLRTQVPLSQVRPASIQPLLGTVRVIDGRIRQLGGWHDVSGAKITIEIGEKAVDASGSVLVAGVPAQLTWQYLREAPAQNQPPLRITATLDNADRRQLGLDLSSVLLGEVPVEVTVRPLPGSAEEASGAALSGGKRPAVTNSATTPPFTISVRADLTKADIVFQSLAWRKPPGRGAALQFDVVPMAQSAGRSRLTLHDLRLVGEGLAIGGSAELDAKGGLRRFDLPQFSINTVSRLEITGERANDGVWDVKAVGPTYDGQDFFRSLFSVGQVEGAAGFERSRGPGLRLRVEIANVIGFDDVALRAVKLDAVRSGGKLVSLIARGTFDGDKNLEVGIQGERNRHRRMVALSEDAGQAFRLVGFYPNAQGGRMRLEIDLDARGDAEKSGVLTVENFLILGDPIVSELVQSQPPPPGRGGRRADYRGRVVQRQTLQFDSMRAPFSVGYGQFVLQDAELRGPLLGATLRGTADFRRRTVKLGGTYVPLQGLNAALSAIPGLGQILTGPRGEGVLGMNFLVQGAMAQPEVIVHPLSMVAPGIFREMFQLAPMRPHLTAPQGRPASPTPRSSASDQQRAPAAAGGWSSETLTSPQR